MEIDKEFNQVIRCNHIECDMIVAYVKKGTGVMLDDTVYNIYCPECRKKDVHSKYMFDLGDIFDTNNNLKVKSTKDICQLLLNILVFLIGFALPFILIGFALLFIF